MSASSPIRGNIILQRVGHTPVAGVRSISTISKKQEPRQQHPNSQGHPLIVTPPVPLNPNLGLNFQLGEQHPQTLMYHPQSLGAIQQNNSNHLVPQPLPPDWNQRNGAVPHFMAMMAPTQFSDPAINLGMGIFSEPQHDSINDPAAHPVQYSPHGPPLSMGVPMEFDSNLFAQSKGLVPAPRHSESMLLDAAVQKDYTQFHENSAYMFGGSAPMVPTPPTSVRHLSVSEYASHAHTPHTGDQLVVTHPLISNTRSQSSTPQLPAHRLPNNPGQGSGSLGSSATSPSLTTSGARYLQRPQSPPTQNNNQLHTGAMMTPQSQHHPNTNIGTPHPPSTPQQQPSQQQPQQHPSSPHPSHQHEFHPPTPQQQHLQSPQQQYLPQQISQLQQHQIQNLALARGTAVIRLLHYVELVASSGPQIHDIGFWRRLVAEFFHETCLFKFSVDSGKEVKSADIPYSIIARFFYAFIQSGVSKIQFCLENIREYPAGPAAQAGQPGPGHFIDCSRCYVNYWYSDGTLVTSRCPLRVLMNSNFKIEWMELQCAQHDIYSVRHSNTGSGIWNHLDSRRFSKEPGSKPPTAPVDITPFGVTASMMRFIEMAETISHMRDLMQYSLNLQLGGPINSLKSLVKALKSRDLSAKPGPAPGPSMLPDMISSPHLGFASAEMGDPNLQKGQFKDEPSSPSATNVLNPKRRRPSSLSQPPKSAT